MLQRHTMYLPLFFFVSFLYPLVDDTGNYRPEITRFDREPETPTKEIEKRIKDANREDGGIDDRNWDAQLKKEERIHREQKEQYEKELARLKK